MDGFEKWIVETFDDDDELLLLRQGDPADKVNAATAGDSAAFFICSSLWAPDQYSRAVRMLDQKVDGAGPFGGLFV